MEEEKKTTAVIADIDETLRDLSLGLRVTIPDLKTQLTLANNVHDGKVSFIYRDRLFNVELPDVTGSPQQLKCAITSTFPDVQELEAIEDKLPATGDIIDIGAGVGLATLWFASQLPDRKVIAFEPSKALFPFLKTNLSANECSESVAAVNSAVLAEAAYAEPVFARAKAPMCTLFRPSSKPTGYSATCLDDMRLSDIALIRCALPARQMQVISSAAKLIEKSHPLIMLYLRLDPAQQGDKGNKDENAPMKRFLWDAGYKLQRLSASCALATPR